jgi:EAL domain-containing protein (putative c-di-GMP-specific phosphodiesterase class I)
MIYIAIEDKKFVKDLIKKLKSRRYISEVLSINNAESFVELMNKSFNSDDILILPIDCSVINKKMWQNFLRDVAKEVSTIIVKDKEREDQEVSFWNLISALDLEKLMNLIINLQKTNKLDYSFPTKPKKYFIPIMNKKSVANILGRNGALSVVTIHIESFQKIGIEYGQDTLQKVKVFFAQMLFSLWGKPGSFRSADRLCRDASSDMVYYIFLDPPRHGVLNLPKPGSIERLIKRLWGNIETILWKELTADNKNKSIPEYLNMFPDIKIGHGTVIASSGMSLENSVENLLQLSVKNTQTNYAKYIYEQREFIQYLMCTEGILLPYYQGVFYIKKLINAKIQKATNNSLGFNKILKESLYGFESLIRIDVKQALYMLKEKSSEYLDFYCLQPDVLFKIARKLQISMELDQKCIEKATHNYKGMDFELFVNILPRNYYRLKDFYKNIPNNLSLTFEISETEVVNNYSLIQDNRRQLSLDSFSVAIDDFGKGYSDIDRVLKIKPDIIKLDRVLTHGIHKDEIKQMYLKGIVSASSAVGSKILAEGVENFEDLQCLDKLGVFFVQGYYIHYPEELDKIKKRFKIKK